MSTGIREDLDIAVIGLAGRFPGADDCTQFWRNLLMGVDAISNFSEQQLLDAGHDAAKILDANFVPTNGVVQGAEYFDAGFFGFSQAEAALLDPQTRLMMECVWHALENASFDPDKRSRNVGLFLGARSTVQWAVQAMLSDHVENVGGFLASQLANKDAMSTLISAKLGLEGPSFTLQAACSTSLVSVHQAMQSLLSGECDCAVAGGVSLLLPQCNGHTYHDGMLFSRDGKTRTFDAQATGSVFGSGLGVVVLRRAADAVADQDPIWAILRGSAVNNDGGRKAGYTAPSVKGQAAVIRAALQMAEVEPDELDFIECHGTATALGDSIEFMALQQVFGASRTLNRCALGALKTNIGHLDSAAGIAGLIKTVMAVRHGVIPPTLHFERPNSQLDFEQSPFYVNTCAVRWPARPGKLRTAAISSFGVGGTNAHVVVRQHVPEPDEGANTESANTESRVAPWFFPVSAKDRAALVQQLESLSTWLVSQADLDLRALSHTLTARPSFACRVMLVANSKLALLRQIERCLTDENANEQEVRVREALGQPTIGDGDEAEQLAAVLRWVCGAAKSPEPCLRSRLRGPALMDVPGYAFLREEHGAGHIAETTWARITAVLASPQEVKSSRNGCGLLAPFWKRIRPWREVVLDERPRSVLLIDPSLVTEPAWQVDTEHVEVVGVDMLCMAQVTQALARLAKGSRKQGELVLGLALPTGVFGFAPASLARLADFGRVLLEADFSAFESAHVYLLAPAPAKPCAMHIDATLTLAALQALALIVPQESPGVEYSFVGIHDGDPAWTPQTLMRLLQTKLQGPLELTGEGVFVQDFRCLDAKQGPIDAAPSRGKTYVITGAGGRMAREMADIIARRFHARLALITRQDPQSEAMRKLRSKLMTAGAEAVEFFPFTLESEAEAVAVFRAIGDRLGDIGVVIHAAGVTDGASFSPIAQLDAAHYQEQLGPKARAAAVLANVFTQVPVQRCFVISSMSAFFGGIAHAPYATANLFLDGWARLQNRSPAGPDWVVVNWETIHFADSPRTDRFAWGANEIALQGSQFRDFVEETLREHDGEMQRIVAAGRFMDRLRTWGGRRASGEAQPASRDVKRRPRPEAMKTAYAPPGTETQAAIADIWGAILGIEGIGIDDRFNELGGDSLKTIVMAERLYKRLSTRISIKLFIERPTIRGIEEQILSGRVMASAVRPAIDRAAPIIASADQELIYLHQTTFADASYNMPVAFRCRASLEVASIAMALERMATRHGVLKCVFARQDTRLVMLPQLEATVHLSVREAAPGEQANLAHLEQFANVPFDLHQEIPIRALVIRGEGPDRSHQVLIVVHHIVCDGVSLGVLADDFLGLLEGRELPEPRYSFAEYRRQQLETQSDDVLRKQRSYWLAHLMPLPPPVSLPVRDDYAGPIHAESSRGVTIVKPLSQPASEAAVRLCEELGVTPFTFFLAAFGVLLVKVAAAEACLLGVPVTGRTEVEELGLVGYLVNMLALRIEPEPDVPFAHYAVGLDAEWEASRPYQTYPMSRLLDELRKEDYCQQRQGKHPLFDVVFSFLPASLSGEDVSLAGFSRLELGSNTAKFDLAMEVMETAAGFDCTMQYRQQMFAESTVAALFEYFFALVDQILADPETEIQDLLAELSRVPSSGVTAPVDGNESDLEFNF
jgi:3-oxoacyl-(acyl-carrier-protein) synthase/NAD(P)-dependent dehydrogenase (short-subunit alcohol dehydrogenase family)